MNFPKYTVCKKAGQQIWMICKGRKVIREFDDESIANQFVQSLVEDDRWNAANRD